MIIDHIHCRPQTFFFQGRAKFSRGWGAKTYCLPKEHQKNIQFISKKVKKHTILSGQGGGGKNPLLPYPADAHDHLFS